MKTQMVSAKRKEQPDKVYSCPLNVPETLEEAAKTWGPEVTLSNAIANVVVWFQGKMRTGMEKGLSNEDLSAQLATAKPGVVSTLKIDPEKAVMERAKTDPAFRAHLIKLLQAEAKTK